MPVISDGAIASVAKGAGLSGDAAAIATAIALAESGGNTTSHNALPPDNSYGLWQINMLGSMGPERRTKYGLANNEALYDPATNARVMFALSSGGTNWKPWTTYTRGTYLLYLNRGRSAAGTTTQPNDSSSSIPVVSLGSLDSISQFFKQVASRSFWIRAGLLILGVGLVLYGLLKTTGDNQLSQGTKTLAKGALSFIPGVGAIAGKVVK